MGGILSLWRADEGARTASGAACDPPSPHISCEERGSKLENGENASPGQDILLLRKNAPRLPPSAVPPLAKQKEEGHRIALPAGYEILRKHPVTVSYTLEGPVVIDLDRGRLEFPESPFLRSKRGCDLAVTPAPSELCRGGSEYGPKFYLELTGALGPRGVRVRFHPECGFGSDVAVFCLTIDISTNRGKFPELADVLLADCADEEPSDPMARGQESSEMGYEGTIEIPCAQGEWPPPFAVKILEELSGEYSDLKRGPVRMYAQDGSRDGVWRPRPRAYLHDDDGDDNGDDDGIGDDSPGPRAEPEPVGAFDLTRGTFGLTPLVSGSRDRGDTGPVLGRDTYTCGNLKVARVVSHCPRPSPWGRCASTVYLRGTALLSVKPAAGDEKAAGDTRHEYHCTMKVVKFPVLPAPVRTDLPGCRYLCHLEISPANALPAAQSGSRDEESGGEKTAMQHFPCRKLFGKAREAVLAKRAESRVQAKGGAADAPLWHSGRYYLVVDAKESSDARGETPKTPLT